METPIKADFRKQPVLAKVRNIDWEILAIVNTMS